MKIDETGEKPTNPETITESNDIDNDTTMNHIVEDPLAIDAANPTSDLSTTDDSQNEHLIDERSLSIDDIPDDSDFDNVVETRNELNTEIPGQDNPHHNDRQHDDYRLSDGSAALEPEETLTNNSVSGSLNNIDDINIDTTNSDDGYNIKQSVNDNGSIEYHEPTTEFEPSLNLANFESEDELDLDSINYDESAMNEKTADLTGKKPNKSKLLKRLYFFFVSIAAIGMGAQYFSQAPINSHLGQLKMDATMVFKALSQGSDNPAIDSSTTTTDVTIEPENIELATIDEPETTVAIEEKPIFTPAERPRLLSPEVTGMPEPIEPLEIETPIEEIPESLSQRYNTFAEIIGSPITMVSASNPQFILTSDNTRWSINDAIDNIKITGITIDSVEITYTDGEAVVIPFN